MRSFTSFAACLGLAVALSTPAHAALMELDLDSAGDKLITYDTATGLEWLDVVATQGLGYDQVNAWLVRGFRHATTDDLTALLTNVGITDQTGNFVPANVAGVTELLAKLGCTAGCTGAGAVPTLQGLLDFVPLSPFSASVSLIRLSADGLTASATVSTGGFPKINSPHASNGNFLLRNSVPVPESGALSLLGIGLAGLGFARRRKPTRGSGLSR